MGLTISGRCEKCGKPYDVPLAFAGVPTDQVALNDLMTIGACPECAPEEWMQKRDALLSTIGGKPAGR